jgi:hypothetical protein
VAASAPFLIEDEHPA